MKTIKSTYLIFVSNRSCSLLLFIFFSFICVHNRGLSQEDFQSKLISLKTSKGTIRQILDELKDRTDCVFTYSSARVNLDEEVYIGRRKKSINEILETIFEKQPIVPHFKEDKRIILAYDIYKNQFLATTTILNGFIKDKATGEPLIGASIYNVKNQIGSLSNDFGYFQFQVNQEVDTVTFSYLGYKPRSIPIKKLKKELFSLFLTPEPLKIDDVIIERKTYERSSSDLSSNHYFNEAELKNRRGTLGENDPFQTIFSLPGVQSGHEAQNNIFVRGGGPDQNLIMMDGVPMYETSHLLGLTSVFNADAVKNIQLFKQAFPSAYGGRLSSVVNFHIAEGNLKEHKFGVGISPLSTRVSAEGPLAKGITSYNLTVRKSLLDLVVDPIAARVQANNTTKSDISFYDINAKVHHNLSDGSNLDINAYVGNDNISIRRDEEFNGDNGEIYTINNHDRIRWSNRLFNVRWNKIVSDKLFTKVQFHLSNYSNDSQSTYGFTDQASPQSNGALDVLALSQIEDASFKLEANYFVNNNIKAVIGGGTIFHKYNPSLKQSQIVLSDDITEYRNDIDPIDASEWYGYGETQIDVTPQLHINAGAQLSRYLVRDKIYSSLQPRLSIAYAISKKQQLSISATKMTQYIHLLVNTGIGLPSELWIPTTDILEPEHSYQLSGSYKYEFSNRFYFTVDAYYKSLKNIVEYTRPFDLFNTYVNDNNGTKIEGNNDWEQFVSSGDGTSKGVELYLQKQEGKLKFVLGYSLSKTDRVFSELNDGERFPFKYDRTHDINVNFNYQLSKKFKFDAGWVYGTGNAFSMAVEQFPTIGSGTSLNADVRNNLRMPAYHKLDVGISYETLFKNSNRLRASVGVFNAYNRQNAFYIYLVEDPVEDTFKTIQVSVFPILPNFDVHYSF